MLVRLIKGIILNFLIAVLAYMQVGLDGLQPIDRLFHRAL